MIILKQVLPEDWQQVLAIEQSANSPLYFPCTDEDIVKKYMDKSLVYFIINNDNQIVGTISFEIKGDNDYYCDGLVIMPEYRGKGYALEAVKEMLKLIGGHKHIHLVVHPHNTPAIITYLKAGFVVSGWKDNYFGDGEPRIEMAR
ncbi:MAG: GNAT family N-acetyltransferase [Patescibacteria group bacterium]|jgi:RimJ/RimL family protein N-acetyltransferase